MGLKRKQLLVRQKAYFEQQLLDRLAFLSGKGIESLQADKDTLIRNLQGNIRAMKNRLRVIAGKEKRTEELTKAKADRAAASQREREGGKGEKPKKAPEQGKGKKIKADKKAVPPQAAEASKNEKPAESSKEGKETMKKKEEETREEPAGQGKADKS